MSGRGCTIQLEVLQDDSTTATMFLPVALHSPLEVLKQQLEELTGIEFVNQVVILCDLNDKERNSDILLDGRDYMSLRECGIKNNSTLTLHRLGLPPAIQRHLSIKCGKSKIEPTSESKNHVQLCTPITAKEADHSYNGVIFDIEAKGPYEVDILSLSVGGMLGLVRVFARDRPWEQDKTVNRNSHWWAHRESVSERGWEQVAEQMCSPSWDRPVEVKFDIPVTLLPHQRRGFYIHSGLPDDLGIQYQSYNRDDIVAEDEHVVMLPGVGHTGHTPFDDQHGWYRSFRGLAGAMSYSYNRKGWHPHVHFQFPLEIRESVRHILLCHTKGLCCPQTGCRILDRGLPVLPKFVVYYIMEFMHWDWFDGLSSSLYRAEEQSQRQTSIAAREQSATSSTGRDATARGLFYSVSSGEEGGEYSLRHFLEAQYHQLSLQFLTGMIGDDDDDDEDVEEEEEEEDVQVEEEQEESEDADMNDTDDDDDDEWEDVEEGDEIIGDPADEAEEIN